MRQKNRALSSLYGFSIIYLLIIASIASISNIMGLGYSVSDAMNRRKLLDSLQQSEHLSFNVINSTINAFNDGAIPLNLAYLIYRFADKSSLKKVDSEIPIGSSYALSIPKNLTSIGFVTSNGNIFWYNLSNQGSAINFCVKGVSKLTMSVSPQSSGFTEPSGIQEFCTGDLVKILATPYNGYAFREWIGNGVGSYSGNNNPAYLLINGSISEQASFEPDVSIVSIMPSIDGYALNSLAIRNATIEIIGQPQLVQFSAGSLPSGVSVSFNPSQLMNSMNGAYTKMSISYSASSIYTNLTIPIIAKGEDGRSSTMYYTLYVTPPNGLYSSNRVDLGSPREHKSAFWNGIYYVIAYSSGVYYYSYKYTSSSWQQLASSQFAECPYSGNSIDIYQYGNSIFYSAITPGYNSWYFNIGTLNNGYINWLYGTGTCGQGLNIGTTYMPGSYISIIIDSSSNIWVALDEYNNGYYYIEVMRNSLQSAYQRASAIAFETVYMSPPFSYEPIPQLIGLKNGNVALIYQLKSSQCNPDYMLYTKNNGLSWSQPIQLTTSSGNLCWANSSGTSIGDKIYFGGMTSNNKLSFWSFDFDTMLSISPQNPIDVGVSAAAITSASGIIALAYTKNNQLYVAWSYDSSDWLIASALGSMSTITLPLHSNSFQLPIVGYSYQSRYMQISFFTV